MCTLILAWRVFDDAPVLVAANRDEATGRRSSPPRRWDDAGVPFVAPRDEQAGGTWIGFNDAGLFVGISNRWTDRELTGERSRGQLVADTLCLERATDAVALVQEDVGSTDYEGFNLLLVDARDAVLLEWDGELGVTPVEPGVHVLMNAGFDDEFRSVRFRTGTARRQAETARQVLETMHPRGVSAAEWMDRARRLLGDHDLGICVHGDGYGTQSASLIRLPATGAPSFRFADGPPCTTAFEPFEGQS